LTIYNVPPQPPNWNGVGVFYVTFCATWTSIVAAGMAFCWVNRNLPILKVRGLGLSFASVVSLHLYWIMAQITYPVGVTMPIVIAYSVQYFVMGTWFPLGIALFHAANLRFLHIAKRQKQFTLPSLSRQRGCNGGHSSWLCRFRSLNYDTKVVSYIAIGLVIQVRQILMPWLIGS
jgi:fatty acid desaturase